MLQVKECALGTATLVQGVITSSETPALSRVENPPTAATIDAGKTHRARAITLNGDDDGDGDGAQAGHLVQPWTTGDATGENMAYFARAGKPRRTSTGLLPEEDD